MPTIKSLLGKRIKEIRRKLGFKQDQLAEVIGIDPKNLGKIENGKNYPTNENLEKIAEALKVKPFELYMFEHLNPVNELREEIFQALEKDENLTRLMYKIYLSFKF